MSKVTLLLFLYTILWSYTLTMRFIQTIQKNMLNVNYEHYIPFGYFKLQAKNIGCSRTFIQDNKAHLSFIEILPDFRRQGHGTKLLSETENILRSQNVSQLSLLAHQPYSSSEVVDFYKKNGYVISNNEFGMYDDDSKMWDLVQMHKILNPTGIDTLL